ncbi:MAG TPA: MFS transporter [Conexibacter sp.]|nr:MFS transporter [Conexibacter sp.]
MSATAPSRRPAMPAARSRQTLTLVAVSVGLFMLLLDLTIVYAALPSLKTSLGASLTQLQWVVDAYAMALAATLLACGALADIVGRRRIFSCGLGLFALASLGCGLARTAPELIAGRTIQGVGAAMMFSTSFAIISVTFEGRARAKALGTLGAVAAVAGALGPLAGGVCTQTFGWPSIFFVNVPLGACALVVASRGIAESRRPEPPRVDWAGTLLFSALLGMLGFALLRGNGEGWSSGPILALLGGAMACLLAFVLLEQRRRDPLLELGLFRHRAFLGVSLASFAQAASLFSMLLYITLYLQGVLGYSPLASGLCLLPISLAAMLLGLGAAWLSVRLSVRALLAGGLMSIAAGLALMTLATTAATWTRMLPGFLLAGAGLGLINPPLGAAAVDVAPAGRSGLGSGINATFRQVGVAIGIAGYGAIFEHRVSGEVLRRVVGTPLYPYASRISRAVAAGGQGESLTAAPAAWRPLIRDVGTHAFVGGLHLIVLVAAVIAAASAVAVAMLVRPGDLGSVGRDASSQGVRG